MSAADVPPTARRGGDHTRREAQRVALDLFTAQGYEATSLREIAAALGINKASLYYHFESKEAILASLLEDRGSEAEDLLEWIAAQELGPELLETAVLRWVDSFSGEKLRGIRFLVANPIVAANLGGGERIGAGLTGVADALAGLLERPTPADRLLVRMAILSINAAVQAAAGTTAADEEILRAAHLAASGMVGTLRTKR